jgi:hypothetical protein
MHPSDEHLWQAYADATTDDERKRIAAQIVEHHMGFLRMYAKETAFPYWDYERRETYLHELVIAALERVPRYTRNVTGHGGRSASFPTFFRKSVRLSVAWTLAGDLDAPIRTGRETRKVKALVEEYVRRVSAELGRPPEIEEIAGEVSRALSKPVGAARVRRILDAPEFIYPDANIERELGWDRMGGVTDHAQAIVDDDETAARTQLVRDLLAAVRLTDRERVILVERLMAPAREVSPDGDVVHPGPTRLIALGQRWGMSGEAVRKIEQGLLAKLRAALPASEEPLQAEMFEE